MVRFKSSCFFIVIFDRKVDAYSIGLVKKDLQPFCSL